VAVDTFKTLKFYDFIDKKKKEEAERMALEEEEIIKGLKDLFDKYDADQNGLLTFDEFSIMVQDYNSAFGVDKSLVAEQEWTIEHQEKLLEIFKMWDHDGSNFLTKSVVRPLVKNMLKHGLTQMSPKKTMRV